MPRRMAVRVSAADEVRRTHAEVITRAEARAADDVARGVADLKVQIDRAQWHWDRQILEGHLARIENA